MILELNIVTPFQASLQQRSHCEVFQVLMVIKELQTSDCGGRESLKHEEILKFTHCL